MRKRHEEMLPILLVAKDAYLNSLQSGNVYLKNCLYYQQLEGDEQRSDKYDSAIPSKLFSLPNVSNGRITNPAVYIKSFFQYKPENIKILSETQIALCIPDNSAKSLKEFSKNTEGNALLIWDTAQFIDRFAMRCNDLKIKWLFDSVKYIDNSQFAYLESMTLPNISERRMVFTKRKRYENQQEFRIAVSFHIDIGDSPEKVKGIKIPESIDLSMKEIDDISSIVNLQEIIDEPMILLGNKDNKGR